MGCGIKMKVTITLRGTLKKYLNGQKEISVEVPDDCTCDEALQIIGIHYKDLPNFGFVAINSMRVMIHDRLKEGDELKAYSRISGG
jgi:hypothetical protein